MKHVLMTSAVVALCLSGAARAASEENAEEFMRMHQVEAVFHEAGSTKNIELMLSLFADDAVLTAGGKTHVGKDQVKKFFQAAGPFQPQNEWVGYTPAFRIRYDVQGNALTSISNAYGSTRKPTKSPRTSSRTTTWRGSTASG